MKTKLAFVCVQLSIFGMTLSLFAQDITRSRDPGAGADPTRRSNDGKFSM